MEIILRKKCWNTFELEWYIENGIYHTNTRSFFLLVKQHYNIVNKVIEIIFNDPFCCVEICSTYKTNNFGTVTNSCPLIRLRKSKISKELKNKCCYG